MNTQRSDAIFDKNQIKEYIGRVENDTAEFIGAEFCAARLIGFVSKQHALGEVNDTEAAQLLADARHLANLAQLGQKYAKAARNPSPELRIMVLAQEQKEKVAA